MPEQDPTGLGALSKATGISRGRSRTQQTLGDLLEMAVDAFSGAIGLPTGIESKAGTFGELLSMAAPFMAGTRALKAAMPAKQGIKAYHGSPHDFDQFSLSKIGTGEGAQAYGHGLYMTETPAVGRGYRDIVPATDKGVGTSLDTDLRIGGRPVNDVYSEIERKAARMSPKDAEPLYEQLSGLESLMQHGDFLGVREAAQAGQVTPRAMQWMESIEPKFSRRGSLYEVNIHADPEDFLDWDAPLSQQTKVLGKLSAGDKSRRYMELQDALEQMQKSGKLDTPEWNAAVAESRQLRESAGGIAPTMTGEEIWNNHRLAANPDYVDDSTWQKAAPAAREMLQQRGIPGIKYLDGASRSAGQGSRNYVVFDDKLIDIVKKYGIAGALSAGLINQAQAQQMQAQGMK